MRKGANLWTDEETALAVSMAREGVPLDAIAASLGRTRHGVKNRLINVSFASPASRIAQSRRERIRKLCSGEVEPEAYERQVIARCVPGRGGGYVVTTRNGRSGWSAGRLSAGEEVVILPGGEARRVAGLAIHGGEQ